MDYKKTNAPLNTQTRDLISMSEDTGNVYETVCIIAKRSNQIAAEMKHDLEKKLQEFASLNDNLEEISENREQIEISRFYERLPSPPSSQHRSISTTRFTSATPPKTSTRTKHPELSQCGDEKNSSCCCASQKLSLNLHALLSIIYSFYPLLNICINAFEF